MNVAWGGRVLPSRARPAVASRRKYLIGLLVTLLTLAGCAPSEPPPLRVQGRTMGTQYALVILQPPRLLESRALKQDVLQAEVELADLNNHLLQLLRQQATVQARINALLNRAPDAPLPPAAQVTNRAVPPTLEALQRLSLIHI